MVKCVSFKIKCLEINLNGDIPVCEHVGAINENVSTSNAYNSLTVDSDDFKFGKRAQPAVLLFITKFGINHTAKSG